MRSRVELEIIPPAHIPAHVGWRIQSTTKESSLSHMVTHQAWATWWHYHYHYNHEGGVNTGQAEGYTCHQCWSWKIQSSLGVPLLTLLTTFSIFFDYVDWWNSVFAWWCLSLWPCLIRFFVMIVGVLWVFYLQWHQLSRWVLMYLPPLCYPLFFYLIL